MTSRFSLVAVSVRSQTEFATIAKMFGGRFGQPPLLPNKVLPYLTAAQSSLDCSRGLPRPTAAIGVFAARLRAV